MIQEISVALGGIDEIYVWLLLTFAVLQIGVQVWALVDLVRVDRVVGDRKWLWALAIIFLSNFALGAILYFAIGRRVPEAVDDSGEFREPDGDRAARAVDALYGPADGDTR